MSLAESGAPDGFSAFLSLAPQPLHSALVIASRLQDADQRDRLVESALTIDRSDLNSRDIQLLTRYAKRVPRTDAGSKAKRWSAIGSPAAKWLCAALLEELSAYDNAAEILASINDSTWEEERALRLLALARTTIRAGRISDAVLPLRHAAQAARTAQTLHL